MVSRRKYIGLYDEVPNRFHQPLLDGLYNGQNGEPVIFIHEKSSQMIRFGISLGPYPFLRAFAVVLQVSRYSTIPFLKFVSDE